MGPQGWIDAIVVLSFALRRVGAEAMPDWLTPLPIVCWSLGRRAWGVARHVGASSLLSIRTAPIGRQTHFMRKNACEPANGIG